MNLANQGTSVDFWDKVATRIRIDSQPEKSIETHIGVKAT
jgi:hypothetical protein